MSHPSPSSSATSASPVPPPTPLTPNSAHVTFAVPHDAQFTFDGLNLESQVHQPNNANANANAQANTNAAGPIRRKPSRRANTAERRATHNAVERQRRETLNSRFLDLAALLPNLASVRRPSKSAIVNSSIALIHTQRRARSTAARELRLLKLEADQLRSEVNEWRERAGMGLARVDEPLRSREFDELVSGGLEEAEESHLEEERRALEIVKESMRLEAAGLAQGQGADLMNPFAYGGGGMFAGLDDEEDDCSDGNAQVARAMTRPASQGSVTSGLSQVQLPMPIAIPRAQPQQQQQQPMIFDPSAQLLQAHTTQNVGIHAANTQYAYDLSGAYAVASPAKWNPNAAAATASFAPYAYQQQGFLGGFGLRDDSDATDGSSSCGSVPDLAGFHNNLRTRSASNLSSAATPPSSAPASATTYAEAAAAGDAFAAAYAAFPAARIPGGGNTYGAAMGLFM